MLGRQNIHNSAMLYPDECKSLINTGEHAFSIVKGKDYQQCIDCGTLLKEKGNTNGLRHRQLHNSSSSTNLSR